MRFINLHNHIFSSFDSLGTIQDRINWCKKNSVSAIALTDHATMCGAYSFWEECEKNNIKPIIGVELNVVLSLEEDATRYHFVFLAKNKDGYEQLLKLVYRSSRNFYYKPRFLFREFIDENINLNSLVATSGCVQNLIAQKVIKESEEKAIKAFELCQQTFPDFYLEFQPNHSEEYKKVIDFYLKLITEKNAKFILTSDSHYVNKSDYLYHKMLAISSMKKNIYDKKALEYFNESNLYLFTDEDVYREFDGLLPSDIIEKGIKATNEVAEKIENYELRKKELQIPIPTKPNDNGENINYNELLKNICYEKLEELNLEKEKYDIYKKRLEEEFEVIISNNFSKYFLTLKTIVEKYREMYGEYSVGFGRGSAAGSLVVYLCGITQVDPIKFDLSFTRFLNKYRVSNQKINL